MLRYLITRALSLGASLIVASLVIFAMIEVIPGVVYAGAECIA